VVPGGTLRNLAALEQVQWGSGVAEDDRLLLADAQTSGGLLLAVAPDRRVELVAALEAAGTPARAVIGELTDEAGVIKIEPGG
jgi:selenide,water dikinase